MANYSCAVDKFPIEVDSCYFRVVLSFMQFLTCSENATSVVLILSLVVFLWNSFLKMQNFDWLIKDVKRV